MPHVETPEEFREEATNLLDSLFEAHDCPACNLNILTTALLILFAGVHANDPEDAQKHFRILESNIANLYGVIFCDGSYH